MLNQSSFLLPVFRLSSLLFRSYSILPNCPLLEWRFQRSNACRTNSAKAINRQIHTDSSLHHILWYWCCRDCVKDLVMSVPSGCNTGWREDEPRSLVVVSALRFLQCFDTVGWVAGRASSATYPQGFYSGTSEGRKLQLKGWPRFSGRTLLNHSHSCLELRCPQP